jgi:hypothetical protein
VPARTKLIRLLVELQADEQEIAAQRAYLEFYSGLRGVPAGPPRRR